jgi:hypothetical protein
MTFSLVQLRAIAALTSARLSSDCGESRGRWEGLLREAEGQIATAAPRELVFRIELPIEPVDLGKPGKRCLIKLAPTLNEYASAKGWAKAKARTEVDRRIFLERPRWLRWHCGIRTRAKMVGGEVVKVPLPGTGRRRLVRLIRRSSRRVDEVSLDVLGGKLPVDRLKIAEVIAGDSAKWLEREAVWEPCDPGDGRVIVEVYELPGDLGAPRVPRTRKR